MIDARKLRLIKSPFEEITTVPFYSRDEYYTRDPTCRWRYVNWKFLPPPSKLVWSL